MKFPSILSFLCVIFTIIFLANAESTFKPLRPPAIPLAVRSPYLSTWLKAGSNGGNGGYLPGSSPVHWSDVPTQWGGIIRVDGKAFNWMGNLTGLNLPNADQTSLEYTSTKSIFQFDVDGKVQLTATFLSPIAPTDLKRQSLVASYLEVAVKSIDGDTHEVQVYSDITAEWAAGDRNTTVDWAEGETDGVKYFQIKKTQQLEFDESDKPFGNGVANWGSIYWATDDTERLTSQSGPDSLVRNAFLTSGHLSDQYDLNFRSVYDNTPVFGFSQDFDRIGSMPRKALFSIGLYQRNAAQFEGTTAYHPVASYWTTFWATEVDAVQFFHNDYSTGNRIATSLDQKIADESTSVAGSDYASLTSLSVRQALGATVLAGDSNQQYLFMKEISSNGNFQTVDVLFPMHPIILYLNPALLKIMLDPLYENQESGKYPNPWAIHDLGAHFPNATGHPTGDDEAMPVEECGNMIIMTLAYAQKTQDTAYLSQHYPKLQQWAQFLIDDSLIPDNQLSTDDFAGRLHNQTNLALKGIIGIQAMSSIASLIDKKDDQEKYNTIAHDYINKWTDYGVAKNATPPHTTLNYGANETHGLLYNLWCDLELGLGLVPQWVYQMQSDFYPTVKQPYGVPLDTRHIYTKGDWELWVASSVSLETRDIFIKDLVKFLQETPTSRPWTDLYDTQSADFAEGITFTARPVVGGVFSLLIARPDFL